MKGRCRDSASRPIRDRSIGHALPPRGRRISPGRRCGRSGKGRSEARDAPPGMTERAEASDDRPETRRPGPTDDDPTNPTTG